MRKYFVAVCLLFCLLSCDNGDNVNLRFINSSPDAPDLDLVADDDRLFRGVSFSSSTEYLGISTGDKEFKIRPANSTSDLAIFDFELSKDTDYTVIAIDFLSQISPLILVDDNENAEEDKVKLRVVNASPSAGIVDFYAADSSVSLNTIEPIVRNLAFGQSSDYLILPAGAYQIRATRAGRKIVIAEKRTNSLNSTEVYTSVLQDGKDGGYPLGISVIDDTTAINDVDDN